MKLCRDRAWLVTTISFGYLISPHSVYAQISSDGTLPTTVTRSGNVFEITDGVTARTNLFHSFLEFSIPTGGTAYFNNALNIQNIISRVTGSSISDIDGLIKANGTANLFLINPKGIIFGSNASLDIGGSFVASTASSITFADGTEFSAVNSSASPLLTISVPIGLQYYGNEGDIIVRAGDTPSLNSVSESGDAGQLLDTAQTVNTSGTIPDAISGTLSNNNDVDLYQVYLPAGQPFQATTVRGSIVDTRLFLFDGSGRGLYANDDASGTFQSTVPISQPFTPTVSGTYYLGISSYGNDPSSTGGVIFNFPSGNLTDSGAGLPLSSWDDNGLTYDSGDYLINLTTFQSSTSDGLQVKPGQTLALVGGRVLLEGATLKTPGGQVEIGGLAALGTVELNVDPDTGNLSRLRFPTGVTLTDVSITSGTSTGSLIDVLGEGGGITINARNLEILGQPTAFNLLTSGIAAGQGVSGAVAGDITLNATDTMTINASNINSSLYGTASAGNITLTSDVMTINASNINSSLYGTGSAANITIIAEELSLTNGTLANSSTFGKGNAGDVAVQADVVSLDESYVFSDVATGAIGNTGNVTISAEELSLTNGALLSNNIFGQGNAGNVTVVANKVSSEGSYVSSLVAFGGVGEGGNVIITAQTLSLNNGAQVSSSSLGQGNAGDVTIIADEVSMNGLDSQGFPSGALSLLEGTVGNGGQVIALSAVGNAGNVTITAKTLSVTNGAQVNSATLGLGNAGNVTIIADTISFSGESIGVQDIRFSSGANSGVALGAVGNGGNVTINGGKLSLTNGATVNTQTLGLGNAGKIEININTLEAASGSRVLSTTSTSGQAGNIILRASDRVTLSGTDTGVFASTEAVSTGDGGNIELYSPEVTLSDRATISVNSQGTGNGGNLYLEAETLTLNDASITAATTSGEGGNINLNVENALLLRDNSLISAKAGNNGNGGNITIETGVIAALSPDGSNGSDITATADRGDGGRIEINAQGIFRLEQRKAILGNGTNDIDASSEFGIAGEVEIHPFVDPSRGLTELPTEVLNSTQQIDQSCVVRDGDAVNEFIVTGRGGLPQSPNEVISPDIVLDDLGTLATEEEDKGRQGQAGARNSLQSSASYNRIVEAQGWVKTADGQVILVAQAPTATLHSPAFTLPSCQSTDGFLRF